MKLVNSNLSENCSGDIASVVSPLGYGISPLALLPSTYNSKLNTNLKYVAVDANGKINAFYSQPYFDGYKWQNDHSIPLGKAYFDGDPIEASSKSLIKMLKWNIVNIEESLMSTNFYDKILLHKNFIAPNHSVNNYSLNEGRHYRAIYFNKKIGEIEIPSVYRYVAIDDDGDTHIFKEKPNYQTTGKWTGKGQRKIGEAIWNPNYAFPIYASDLVLKLFGVSNICEIADHKKVAGWSIDTLSINRLWACFTRKENKHKRENELDIEEAVPGAINESDGRTTYFEPNKKTKVQLPSEYTWCAIDDDSLMYLFKEEPSFRVGVWKGRGKTLIGNVDFAKDIDRNYIEELSWKLSNIKAHKFLTYHSHIIKGFHLDDPSIKAIQKDYDLLESTIKLNDDEIEIPDGYKWVAVDANTDLNVFKSEPKLNGAVWEGDGKSQIGVCIWEFSKLDGKPKTMIEAMPEILKKLESTKIKLEDDLNLEAKLNGLNYFKYFFAKYNKIEEL